MATTDANNHFDIHNVIRMLQTDPSMFVQLFQAWRGLYGALRLSEQAIFDCMYRELIIVAQTIAANAQKEFLIVPEIFDNKYQHWYMLNWVSSRWFLNCATIQDTPQWYRTVNSVIVPGKVCQVIVAEMLWSFHNCVQRPSLLAVGQGQQESETVQPEDNDNTISGEQEKDKEENEEEQQSVFTTPIEQQLPFEASEEEDGDEAAIRRGARGIDRGRALGQAMSVPYVIGCYNCGERGHHCSECPLIVDHCVLCDMIPSELENHDERCVQCMHEYCQRAQRAHATMRCPSCAVCQRVGHWTSQRCLERANNNGKQTYTSATHRAL